MWVSLWWFKHNHIYEYDYYLFVKLSLNFFDNFLRMCNSLTIWKKLIYFTRWLRRISIHSKYNKDIFCFYLFEIFAISSCLWLIAPTLSIEIVSVVCLQQWFIVYDFELVPCVVYQTIWSRKLNRKVRMWV